MEDNFYKVEDLFNQHTETGRRIRAIKSLIRGLKEYIDSPQYQGTDNPKLILKRYERRLLELESKNT